MGAGNENTSPSSVPHNGAPKSDDDYISRSNKYFSFSGRRLGIWAITFISVTAGLRELLSAFVEEFGVSPHYIQALLLASAAAVPSVIASAGIDDLKLAPRAVRTFLVLGWLIPLAVFITIAVLGVEGWSNKDRSSEVGMSEYEQRQRVDEQKNNLEKRKAAVRLLIFTPSATGAFSDGQEYLGNAFQFLLSKSFDQYPAIEPIAETEWGRPFSRVFLVDGVKNPNAISLPLYQEMAENERGDLMITSSIKKLSGPETIEIKIALISVDSLEKLWTSSENLNLKDGFYPLIDKVSKELSTVIAKNRNLEIKSTMELPVKSFASEDVEAFELFARALYENSWGEDGAAAISLLEQSVERDPRFAYAWETLASSLDASSNDELIQIALRNAIKFKDRLTLQSYYDAKLDYYDITRPDLSERIKLLEQFKTDFPFNTRPRFLLTYAYRDSGRIEEAHLELDDLIGFLPESDSRAHHIKGHLYEYQTDFSRALGMFEHVATIKMDEPKSWFDLGFTYQRAERFTEARKAYEKMTKTADGGENPFYLGKYAEFLHCQGEYTESERVLEEIDLWADSISERLDLAYLKFDQLHSRGRVSEALRMCDEVNIIELGESPSDEQLEIQNASNATYCKARMELLRNSFHDAENLLVGSRDKLNSSIVEGTRWQEFQVAIQNEKAGNKPLTKINLRKAYRQMEQFGMAQAPEQYRDHDVFVMKANMLAAQSRFEEAEAELLKLMDNRPGDNDHFIELAEFAINQGHYQKAIEYLGRGPGWCPYRAEPLIREAEALKGLGKAEEAKMIVQKVQVILSSADSDYKLLEDLEQLSYSTQINR